MNRSPYLLTEFVLYFSPASFKISFIADLSMLVASVIVMDSPSRWFVAVPGPRRPPAIISRVDACAQGSETVID